MRRVVRAGLIALGPALALGVARFAYGLMLPAMKVDLGWTYAQAGWMNTANAIGYIAGAFTAGRMARVFGTTRLYIWHHATLYGRRGLDGP
jgi:predicted MFS family arabinose efflux permease